MRTGTKLVIVLAVLMTMAGCKSTGKQAAVKAPAAEQVKSYKIVDTGQAETFNNDGIAITTEKGQAFYGQDGDYADVPFKFVDNGDGTITDQNTGLTWLQMPSQDKYTWRKAGEYAANLEFAGHDDWRLPSLKELISIEDFSDGWPYLDTSVFNLGDGEVGKHMQYWSSNFYKAGTTHGGMETAFGLNFGTGHIKGYPAVDELPEGQMGPPPGNGGPEGTGNGGPEGTSMHSLDGQQAPPGNMPPPPPGMTGSPLEKYAWAVRGEEYGINNFVDNGDGTISDLASGLMWMKQDAGKGLDWENSLAYAEDLEFAGYDDWKLPNIKELQSIVDYSGVYPAISPDFFESTDKDAYFWTSTSAYFAKVSPEKQKKYWAWYVAFGFAVGGDGKDMHGAGATRYDTKYEGGPTGEDAERIYNYARAVRVIK
jgi:hypothetical protein